jgi:hypothetical protein
VERREGKERQKEEDVDAPAQVHTRVVVVVDVLL